ncbi:hypothetical protein AALO_G00276320 [Alosa alosa]|uniref:Uncharacterized protein n=1 Tax=Alosa alosa TaxID=278164 RepID=A0AAV6FLT1_9TELE|nr:hypothetical protein AALO_G00276320 [Alosa alosa]
MISPNSRPRKFYACVLYNMLVCIKLAIVASKLVGWKFCKSWWAIQSEIRQITQWITRRTKEISVGFRNCHFRLGRGHWTEDYLQALEYDHSFEFF